MHEGNCDVDASNVVALPQATATAPAGPATEDVLLNDIWTYHFHDPNNEDWNLTSYLRLHNMSTVNDFWNVHECVKDKLRNGMFFIMREHIFPCWDDPNNISGGCLSIKVLKEHLVEYWEELCNRLLGETLLDPSQLDVANMWQNVNGISTSPKRFFCIVKIWMKTNDIDDKKYFRLPDKFYGDIIYRENVEHIQKNNDCASKHTIAAGANNTTNSENKAR